jgi:tripartite-type tricarboxylate transporter receptor subunit TctC
LPDVPAISESVSGYEANTWQGIVAPRNTPAEIVNRLNAEINAALGDPRLKGQLAAMGNTLVPGSPAMFAAHIAAETDKWARVIKFAGIKPD